MTPIEVTIASLTTGGLLSTVIAAALERFKAVNHPARRERALRITTNDGSSVYLDADAVRDLDLEKLKQLLADLVPFEPEGFIDVDEPVDEKDDHPHDLPQRPADGPNEIGEGEPST